MIQARKLGHIVLKVRDARKSKEFYMKTLGLQVASEDLTRGAVFLSFGVEHHDLAVFQMASGETPGAEQPGMHHMAWQVGSFEELRAAYRELLAMGVPVEATVEHNVTRSVYFPDPDGNRVELYCDMVENGFETMRTVGPRSDRIDLSGGEPPRSSPTPPHDTAQQSSG
jgi:catechol-2,3-dioxygenase